MWFGHQTLESFVSWANSPNLLVSRQNENSSLAKPWAQTLPSQTSFRRSCPEQSGSPHLSSLATTKFISCLMASNNNHTRSWKDLLYQGMMWINVLQMWPKDQKINTFRHPILKTKYVGHNERVLITYPSKYGVRWRSRLQCGQRWTFQSCVP